MNLEFMKKSSEIFELRETSFPLREQFFEFTSAHFLNPLQDGEP